MSTIVHVGFSPTQSPAYSECQVVVPLANIREEPKPTARLETQLLLGQTLLAPRKESGIHWIPCRTTYGAEAFIERDSFQYVVEPPTHAVMRTTLVYATQDVRSPAIARLHLNSLVTVEDTRTDFAQCADGWVLIEDLHALGMLGDDPVQLSVRSEGTPYLWGGVTRDGIDCSGLIKLAFGAHYPDLPHSAARIADVLPGNRMDPTEANFSRLHRGDLICWPDHIGIMLNGEQLVHASGTDRKVVIERVGVVLHRRARTGGHTPTTILRPSYYRRA